MKKAVVLGGTEDHIRLIEILKIKDFFVYLLDYLDEPPAKNSADEFIQVSILDKHLVLQILESLSIDLVISTCIDQALLTVAFVAEKLKIPCHISYGTALELTNKAKMKERFVELGVSTSRYVVIHNEDSLKDHLSFPLVIKPVDSNSSKGITKIFAIDQLKRAFNVAKSFSLTNEVIVEEFIEGDELSVDIAIINYQPQIIMVSRNVKLCYNKDNFTISQSYFPVSLSSFILGQIIEIAKKLATGYNIKNGPLLIQLLYGNERINVIEFSSRIGGGSKHHFIKMMTGFDILKWFVELVIGEVGVVKVDSIYEFGCVQYLYASNGIIGSYKGFAELQRNKIINQYFFYKTIGMTISNHISSADRPAGVLIADNDYASFMKKIDFARSHLCIQDINGNNILLHIE